MLKLLLIIAAGKLGGGYDKAAHDLAARMAIHGQKAEVHNYNGSDEITLVLCRNEADLGIAQIDAIWKRLQEGCILKPIAPFGNEYATIWFPPDSPYDELEDLDETNTVLIDTVGSGSDLFWHNIMSIETGPEGNSNLWSQAQTMNEIVALAPSLAQLPGNPIDAVIMVRKPSNDDVALLQAAGWNRGWLYDKDINDVEYDGQSLYEPADSDSAYEVRSYYVAAPAFPSDQIRNLQLMMVK